MPRRPDQGGTAGLTLLAFALFIVLMVLIVWRSR